MKSLSSLQQVWDDVTGVTKSCVS